MARRGIRALAPIAMTLAIASLAIGCSHGDTSTSTAAASSRAPDAPPSATNELPFGPPRPPPLDRALRVLVGGDLLPHRPSLIAPAAIHAALAPLGPLFAKADAVVANYEATTGDIHPNSFRLAYMAPPG